MLKVAKDVTLDEIVILGDYADFYCVSSYQQDPRIQEVLKHEVESVNQGLDELDALFPDAKKTFIEGNHEHRLEKYLAMRAPALFGLTSIEHLFNLNTRPNWKFISYGPKQKYSVLGSKLIARHQPLASTAALTLRKAMSSVAYGHIHKIEEARVVSINDEQHVAFSCGWLGDVNCDLVFGYTKNHPEWQHGFALVFLDENTGEFHHQIIEIKPDFTCVFNGKLYSL